MDIECKKCGHKSKLSIKEFQSGAACPECGSIYKKARRTETVNSEKNSSTKKSVDSGKLFDRLVAAIFLLFGLILVLAAIYSGVMSSLFMAGLLIPPGWILWRHAGEGERSESFFYRFSRKFVFVVGIASVAIPLLVNFAPNTNEKKSRGGGQYGTGLMACERYAKLKSKYPESVDFSTFMSVSHKRLENGRMKIWSEFTASNAFGVKQRFDIYCLVDPSGKLIEANVGEHKY